LTERVGERLGWQTGYESVSDNPYLADFYDDMAAWAFHLQVYFIGHRAEQHLAMYHSSRSAIADRSIYEDAHIFARALRHMGVVTERDYLAYRRTFDLVVRNLPRPDLLLFLKCPVGVLLDRIRQRARDIERGITGEYLTLLDTFYQEWLASFDLCPLLIIHSQDLNFVARPDHLDVVVERIQQRLSGREDLVLPS